MKGRKKKYKFGTKAHIDWLCNGRKRAQCNRRRASLSSLGAFVVDVNSTFSTKKLIYPENQRNKRNINTQSAHTLSFHTLIS